MMQIPFCAKIYSNLFSYFATEGRENEWRTSQQRENYYYKEIYYSREQCFRKNTMQKKPQDWASPPHSFLHPQ